VVDSINLMAYDYSGSWDSVSGHQANLYPNLGNPRSTPFSTDAAVAAYFNAGVTANKLVMGMPMYGRAFEQTSGLGQSFSGTGGGSWENGIWDYKALPRTGAAELYDNVTQASYSYDPSARILISYDTPTSVKIRSHIYATAGWGVLCSGRYLEIKLMVIVLSTLASMLSVGLLELTIV
jgi:chitinase